MKTILPILVATFMAATGAVYGLIRLCAWAWSLRRPFRPRVVLRERECVPGEVPGYWPLLRKHRLANREIKIGVGSRAPSAGPSLPSFRWRPGHRGRTSLSPNHGRTTR